VRDPAREWVEDIMSDWELEDAKPTRGKYTWSNKRVGPGHIAARLDRFLVQSSFMLLGLTLSTTILPHSVSDHKPILLEISQDRNLGPIPFRFSPAWLQYEGFQDLVAKIWNEKVRGSPFFVWEEKHRRLKVALKAWAKTQKNPIIKRQEAQKQLENHQLEMEEQGDNSRNSAPRGPPPKDMASSLQRGGKVLATEIQKPLAGSGRQKHQLLPQAS
jgi:hypothetical protein